jgi:transposase-like protein
MKAYSTDLRQKIIDAYKNGEGSLRVIAKRFSVSLNFIWSLWARYKQSGSVEPKPHGGGRAATMDAKGLLLATTTKSEPASSPRRLRISSGILLAPDSAQCIVHKQVNTAQHPPGSTCIDFPTECRSALIHIPKTRLTSRQSLHQLAQPISAWWP